MTVTLRKSFLGRSAQPAEPAYDLGNSQVETPRHIVRFFWKILHQHRPALGSVLDMGAGDGRFAQYGNYDRYVGVEIDALRITNPRPQKHARVREGCVFAKPLKRFDACIGNPPYLMHHKIESPWKKDTISWLGDKLGAPLSGHSNLFLYFMALGLVRSADTGIIALLVPFDWVTRPAARGLREVISENKWNTTVYRFSAPVFGSVETTSSISIIDKRAARGQWVYYDVTPDLEIVNRRGVTGTGKNLLAYVRRGSIFARRGLSPGARKVFVLTDGERLHHGLTRKDVLPCVTSLRGVRPGLNVLDTQAFETEFVRTDRRCWLLRSRDTVSERLLRYLDAVPPGLRATATCLKQTPWYKYEEVGPPSLLIHSGFTRLGPRVLINEIGAIPVGSMYGIYGCRAGSESDLQSYIWSRRVVDKVVPHSGRLHKIEVGQLNTILRDYEGSVDE